MGDETSGRRVFRLRVQSATVGAPLRWDVSLDDLLPGSGAWIDPDSWDLEHRSQPVPFRADPDTLDGRRYTLRFRAPDAGEIEVTATAVVREGPRPAPPAPPDRPVPLIGAGEEISLGSTAALGDLHAGLQTAVDVVDWYGRGRSDLLLTCHGHEGGAYVYAATEATDERGRPFYRRAGRLPDELVLPTCMHALAVARWPEAPGSAAGATQFLVGAEDGYVRALRLVRRTEDGVPVVGPPARLQERGAHLSVGAKACPNVADWDGDGRGDLVIGNAAGQVLLSRNTGSGDAPRFTPPEPFVAGDRPLWLMAGAPGTVQGPSEVKWGYVNPAVGAWRGQRAIVCGDALGHNTLYLAVDEGRTSKDGAASPDAGSSVARRPSPPEVSRGRRLHVLRDGHWVPLVTRWRCRPQLVDWGAGTTVYLQVDEEGKLACYQPLPEGPSAEDGEPRMAAVDRLRYADGPLVQLDSDVGGRIGRLKLAVADWDGDGLPDLLVGGSGTQPVAVNTFGKSSVFLLRNVGAPGQPLFSRPEVLPLHGGTVALFGGHSCVPAPCFLDGGESSAGDDGGADRAGRRRPDLLVWSENGRLYAYRRGYVERQARVRDGSASSSSPAAPGSR